MDSYLRRIFLACLDVDQQCSDNLEAIRGRHPDWDLPAEIAGIGRNFYLWDRPDTGGDEG
ncbi:MAG TPA: hypothetical protein VFJ76_07905 [Solirubrobacterales bacterium]|nr:hypothetical protein [Solirubrobacterales bacterium]